MDSSTLISGLPVPTADAAAMDAMEDVSPTSVPCRCLSHSEPDTLPRCTVIGSNGSKMVHPIVSHPRPPTAPRGLSEARTSTIVALVGLFETFGGLDIASTRVLMWVSTLCG